MTDQPLFLRRKEAGLRLKNRFGFGSAKTLAKLASVGEDGPPYHRTKGGAALYEVEALDQWALTQILSSRRTSRTREAS